MNIVYGVIGSHFVIGQTGFINCVPVLTDPAIVQLVSVPFINPLTQQPEPTKANIMIQAIPMPVKWVWSSSVTILCEPDETSQVVKTYLKSLKDNQALTKK